MLCPDRPLILVSLAMIACALVMVISCLGLLGWLKETTCFDLMSLVVGGFVAAAIHFS